MFMFIMVALLWLMSSILFFRNPQNEKIRWASIIGFFGGFGGIGALLGKGVNRPEWILHLDGIFTSIGHYFTPYGMLIFGLVYSDVIRNTGKRNILKLLCLIPIFIMYPIFQVYPEFKVDFRILALWVVPYVVTANILLIYSAWREDRPTIKRRKILTCIFVIPMFTFVLVTNIILEALGIVGVWHYNPWIIVSQFLVFVYFGARYGILGVRIRFEKEIRDSKMKAARSGSALFNHTIKNEIAKIDLLVNQLKEQIALDEKSSEKLNLVLNSTNHLLELSTRIQSKLNTIKLKESEFSLNESIDRAIKLSNAYLYNNQDIKIMRQYMADVTIVGDTEQLQETYLNIIKNAIEAMDGKGQILIRVYASRKKVYIDFIDNGKGIEKADLNRILDPFYSTKGSTNDYGLGLTQCYNILQKHDGSISVKSQVNKGTIFTLSIPSKRVVDIKISEQSNSNSIGEKGLWTTKLN
ncbi:histidine kinase-, DNA gyrase B-, and HSP90-like ATPase family protein [Priestia megaterium]|uniref:histidine kinase n=2 Tax=Priestia megaterium TaxID=1404 RepID=A0A0B6AYV3_PRIM2|nr:sensor histidine kinase [Priestia megaterium]AJI25863.1 histidine kinase-, DNA gyrase B-, and HSP90-like ATPase family protein [Priestia megaterium NBRC 15308 = ATCC 14581]KFN07541.1 histidine kinase-, DNA gyrase B-, and HSP90-like ATPase family protein [Priestia megaterium]MED4399226.1 sensor histidine kinase [Priestia megaterium]WEZ31031.1 sensor histidine kinase [Priestia megaterium]SUX82375.1 multi-sensor signal transduction histidine kinase, putative [Priestia megaterium]